MLGPFGGKLAWEEKTKDDEAEPGLDDVEPQLDSSGLIGKPDKLW